MKPVRLRSATLAVAVLLAARPAWSAVPLKELTQEKVRAWAAVAVKADRDCPGRAAFWKEVDALVVIDTDRIVYVQKEGVPVNLAWEVVPRRPLTVEERRLVREDVRNIFQYVLFEYDKGLVSAPDVDLLKTVVRAEVAPNPAPAVGENPEECERLRRELAKARAELERLRRPEEPRRYIMVVQPSSMIYYDCGSHCWLPGPASVVYYPAGDSAAPERPRPPAFIPPPPNPVPPPAAPPEKKLGGAEEAERAFWVGYRAYWQGDYDKALAGFEAAVRIDDQDARFWYYQALAERALGDAAKAEASAGRGRALHAAGKPKADLVGAALERVQGQERRFLNAPEVVTSDAKDDR